MSGTQKRGFRLPWTPERGSEDGAGAATIDPGMLDASSAAVSEDHDGGPFEPVEPASNATTRDAAPAASTVPQDSAEAAMINTETPTSEPAHGAWPASDQASAQAARPPVHVEGEARAPRRENPLVAGLVKAMREAALASREETTTRVRAEAATRVEAIKTGSADAAAELRKRADEDIAGIRDWSKAEIARVRQETEDKIEQRRVELAGETQRYAADIDHRVEQVQSTVAAFEADMSSFYELLLAENDPARLATLAERAPEPPDLSGEFEGDAWRDAEFSGGEVEASSAAQVATATTAADSDAVESSHAAAATDEAGGAGAAPNAIEALEAEAAAEAEAEATEGLDMVGPDNWPAAVLVAAERTEPSDATPAPDAAPDEAGHSRLLVSGLTSVAGISAFKGAVGQLPGIRSVSVSSGERGVFIFSVGHEPAVDIGEAVSGLTGFAVRITEATGETLSITAHEPAA